MRKRIFSAVVTVGFMVSILAGQVFAAHPLITDDTGTQGKGKFQIEATGTWNTDQENQNGEGMREISSLAGLVLTAGVSETLDLVVEIPYVWTEMKAAGEITKNDGLIDTVVAAKWRFWEKRNFSLAIKPGILLPTGDEDKGLGAGKIGYLASFISTAEIEPWTFDLNLAYFHLENKVDERTDIWFGSLATRLKVAGSWTLVGEVGATRNANKADSSHPAFAQIGLIYSPLDNLDLSAGFLMGLNDAEVDEAIRLGLTVRF
jgi:hypothetical protein